MRNGRKKAQKEETFEFGHFLSLLRLFAAKPLPPQ
jgi:hypothetical protein